jgi:tetratricopeptide (TPR) repeat protein
MHRRDQWISIIQKFGLVYKRYFPSNEAYKAIFTTGDLYEQLYAVSRRDKDLDAALEAYKKTVKEFKPGRLTDDALYRQGEIFFNRGEYDAALNSFEKVLTLIPKGDVVAKARSRIPHVKSFVSTSYVTKKVFPKKIKNISRLNKNSSLTVGKKLILEKINYTVGSDSVRVEVHTNEAVTFSQGRLSEPERVYINFNETQLADSVTKNIKIGSRFLKGLRLSQFDKKNTRLVFDLNQSNNLKIGVWSEGARLYIEISNAKLQQVKVVSNQKTPSVTNDVVAIDTKIKRHKEPRKTVVKVSKKRPPLAVNKKSPLIVVDAGHGGKDLGAVGHRGVREKDVNLDIALRLKDILK